MTLSFPYLLAAIAIYANFLLMLHRSDAAGIMLIFGLAFNVGLLGYLGIPGIIPRFAIESLIVFLFLKNLTAGKFERNTTNLFGLSSVILLFLITIVSFIINNPPLFGFAYFLRLVFVYFLFFYAVLNADLTNDKIYKINKFIVFLFILQIPAAFVKFCLVGMSENYIGTLSYSAGSLNITIALLAISFLLPLFFHTKKRIYIWLAFGFIVFSIIGGKRAGIVYFPILFLTAYLFYIKLISKYKKFRLTKNNITTFLIVIIVSLVVIYTGGRLIPSLNPQRKIGGEFNAHYIVNFLQEYNTKSSEHGIAENLGRAKAPLATYNMLKSKGFTKLFFGTGAGNLIYSRFVRNSKKMLLSKYGLGYGARTGILWFIIQTGLLGGLFFLLFHYRLFKKVYLIAQKTSELKPKLFFIGFLIAMTAVSLDFLTYSNPMMSGAVKITYFYIAAIILVYGTRNRKTTPGTT